MTKSKVGAEPKKQRIRHAITKSEGIHEGIHRDEYGYYDSNYHCYCFAYGYFFHRGISLAVKLTPDYIRDNWIGSFCVSSISYEDKFVDIIKCGHDEPEKLGYKEWKFCIGCHILWFDDIKNFARYYNLQDRLSFPLDRTTAECMENHLIHLPSGRTIEAVGTLDI